MKIEKINPCHKKLLFLIVQGLIFLGACRTTKRELKSLSLRVSYPLVTVDSNDVRLAYLRDTITIYNLNGLVLYRLPESRKFETEEINPGTESYFAFRDKSSSGYYFKSLADTSGIKLNVDSMLKNRAYSGIKIELNDSMRTVGTLQIDKNSYLEKYALTNVTDANTPDSIYLYFSKDLKNLDFSFSRRLDSLKQMKMFKFRIIYNERLGLTKLPIPKREYMFEMVKGTLDNQKELSKFLKRFEGTYLRNE